MQIQASQKSELSENSRILRCKNKPQLLNMSQIYQENGTSDCGYCHKKNSSVSWSFTKTKMQPFTYELLMERGWRRCGTYYYKPNLQKSCCKLFTHRLDVRRFKPKKDQKKALKRVIPLAFEKIEQSPKRQESKHKQAQKVPINDKKKPKQYKKPENMNQTIPQNTKQELIGICDKITIILRKQLPNIIKTIPITEQVLHHLNTDFKQKLKLFKSSPQDKSDYYSNYIQLFFGINKKILSKQNYGLLDFCKQVKGSVQGLGPIDGFQLQVQRGGYLIFKRFDKTNEFQVLEQLNIKQEKMDIQVDKNQSAKINQGGFIGFIQTIKNKFQGQHTFEGRQDKNLKQMQLQEKSSSKFQVLKPNQLYKGQLKISYNLITFGKISVEIVPADENVDSFKLYSKYCQSIHQKKEKSMSSYVNFLCLQALSFQKQQSSIPNQQKGSYTPSWDPTSKHQKPSQIEGSVTKLMGCYHMKYYYNKRLIGVGVIDIVDDGVSSVYFFYDPAYKQHRLGVFSSLIEIQYIRWMQLSFPEFRYYYMGFYVSTTDKMSYKVDYSPCQLLCPITYRFIEFTEEMKKITDDITAGKEKNVRLAAKQLQVIGDMLFGKDIGPYIDKNLKIIYQNRRLVLKEINPQFYIHILKIMIVYLPVWGKKVFQILTITL